MSRDTCQMVEMIGVIKVSLFLQHQIEGVQKQARTKVIKLLGKIAEIYYSGLRLLQQLSLSAISNKPLSSAISAKNGRTS